MFRCSLTPKADPVYVSRKNWCGVQSTLKNQQTQITNLQTQINLLAGGNVIPDEVVTENEFDTLFHQHLADAFGVPIP